MHLDCDRQKSFEILVGTASREDSIENRTKVLSSRHELRTPEPMKKS
jgi:hypothetical protein